MPGWRDILAYGARGALARERDADIEAQRQAKSSDRLEALLKLRDVAGQTTGAMPVGDDNRLIAELPPVEFGPHEQVATLKALTDSGQSPTALGDLSQSTLDAKRAAVFDETYRGLNAPQRADFVNDMTAAPVAANAGVTYNRYDPQGAVLNESSAVSALGAQRAANTRFQTKQTDALTRALAGVQDPARLQAIATGQSIEPVKASGGVLYNRYDAADPILAESSAVSGLGGLRAAQTTTENYRADALGRVVNDPATSPGYAAALANRQDPSTPERVKVQMRDGTTAYFDAVRKPDGTVDYQPATDQQGAMLSPPASDYAPGSTEKNTRFIAQSLGVSDADALRWQKQLGSYGPQRAWADIVKQTLSLEYGKYARDPAQLRAKALEIWEVMRPGEPPPDDLPVPGGSSPAPQVTAAQGVTPPSTAAPPGGDQNDAVARACRGLYESWSFRGWRRGSAGRAGEFAWALLLEMNEQ